ncbi:hypothetical protein [Nocardia rhamnosiphila]
MNATDAPVTQTVGALGAPVDMDTGTITPLLERLEAAGIRRSAGADRAHVASRYQDQRRKPDRSDAPRFLALRVRPAGRTIPRADDATLPRAWLRAE